MEKTTIERVNNGGITTPIGFLANAVKADVKGNGKDKYDFTLLVSEQSFNTAAVFTTNRVKAAPVRYCMAQLEKKREFAGIVVNSGNANACSGAEGMKACESILRATEKELRLEPGMLLAASTGVIGRQMPVERMLKYIPALCEDAEDDKGSLFAEAIMTTDTVKKETALIVQTAQGNYSIGATCKGAGMVDPSMATVLAFVTTDAEIDAVDMQEILGEVVDATFNCITVDGDRSTNDSLYLFANGMSDVNIDTPELLGQFKDALEKICRWMAVELVRDGEGATKLVSISVKGAKNNAEAKKCAASVANSNLVKTMFAGCDPNWGRLMSSAGASGADFDETKVSIWFNSLHYVKNGMIIDEKLEPQAYEIMRAPEYGILLDLGAGDGEAVYYTCDLTKEYVAINADYRS